MKMAANILAAATNLAFFGLIGSAWAQTSDVTIRVAIQGGEFQRVQTKYAADRFTAATGVKVEFVVGNPPDHIQKMITSKGRRAPFDVAYLDDKTQPQAIEAGTVMKLDPSIVTNLNDLYDEAKQKDGYGPAMLFWAWGALYNADAFKKAGVPEPTSWEDLWNPKLAGKVGIFDIGGSGGIDFVVKATELAGGSVGNLQPGLDKIAKLKISSFFTSANQLAASMTAGDTWVVPLNNGRSWGMIDSGFPGKFFIPKEGGYFHTTTIDVLSGTEHPKEAQEYVNYVLDPTAQIGQASEIPYGPVNNSATVTQAMADHPEISKKFPMPGSPMMALLTVPDWNTVFNNYPEVVNAWNRTVKAAN